MWFEPAADIGAWVAHRPDGALTLAANGIEITGSGRVRMSFAGGRNVAPQAERRLPGVSHYFLGNDATRWRLDVPHFAAVRYPDVYPGIDAVFYGSDSTLEYDFVIAPGADPTRIRLTWDVEAPLRLDAEGNLLARAGGTAVKQQQPVAYQEIDGARRPVPVAFRLKGDEVGFHVGDYDPAHPLVIDPIVVVFGTFIGGSDVEFVETSLGVFTAGIASDAAGNVYVAGDTSSTSVVPGGAPSAQATPNVFVVKLNAAGSQVLFATYVGGAGLDARGSLALDGSGNVFVAGRTQSSDFPVTAKAIKSALVVGDPGDAFLVRLGPTGVLDYGTYLGGTGADSAEAVAASGTQTAVVGSTSSSNLTVTGNAAQSSSGGSFDGFVVMVDPTLASPLVYGTYLGGSGLDAAFSVTFDGTGRPVVGGQTRSSNFPTTANAFDTTLGGLADAFVTRFATSGALDYSSFFGGTSADVIENAKVAVDAAGRIYLGGLTNSTDLPAGTTPSPFQGNKSGSTDAFLAKLWPEAPTTAEQLVYRTYFGGSGADIGLAITLDGSGRAYVAGYTASDDLPLASPLSGTRAGSDDGFIARVSATGSALEFATYIGGAQSDYVLALDLTTSYGLYVLGLTSSAAPVPLQSAGGGPAIDSTLGGARDAFVARLNLDEPVIGPSVTSIAPASGPVAGGTLVTVAGSDFAPGATVTIGGTAATGVTVVNATSITATTPAGLAGARDVVVTNPSGLSGTLAGGFTYVPIGPVPTVTSVTPASGSTVGGQPVTITGTNFANGATVTFAVSAATNVVVVNATTITATTPAGTAGAITVSVTNPSGQSGSAAGAYTYVADFDGDGMDDLWEAANGLNPADRSDGTLDPDGDGANNLKEFTDSTNPRVAVRRHFAEGATISIFSTRFAILNDDATRTATLNMEFLTTEGTVLTASRTLPPLTRITVEPKTEVAGLASAEFSATLISNLEIVADRTMTWDATIYGAHAETAVQAPAATWYLAEGATIGGFSLFYLIQNPNDAAATVTVRYLLSSGAPVEKAYTVPARSRSNIWVNTEEVQGVSLNNQELSAVLTTSASTPIIVERAMYLDAGGVFFGAGHESAGVTAPATSWRLAEGATGRFFDLFVLIANPNPATANVTATYLLPSGDTVKRTYQAAPNSRFNIWVDLEPGLADTPVSTLIDTDQPVIVERAMWWPGSQPEWREAHNSPGARETGTRWVLAEGDSGPPGELDTYILVANTSTFPGAARVTLVFEDGTPSLTKEFILPASSRTNVLVGADIGDATVAGKRYGAIIESLGPGATTPAQLVVERAMYWTTGSVPYEAGTNALGSRK